MLKTRRKFDEIYFYGNQNLSLVNEILKKFGKTTEIITFAKSNLTFMKLTHEDFQTWTTYMPELTELNTLNIETSQIAKSSNRISLPKLKKLKCYDSFLNFITAENLDDIQISTTDMITPIVLDNVNTFLELHHKITKFAYNLYCGNENEIQKPAFNLDHLKLIHFKLIHFRYDPKVTARIISRQKNLIKLHLEDKSFTADDYSDYYARRMNILFDEILSLKHLKKLAVELPTGDFLIRIQNMPNLKILNLCDIPFDIIKSLNVCENDKLEKLCLEAIDFGKKPVNVECVQILGKSMINLTKFQLDVAPLNVLKTIIVELKNLKTLKILHNPEVSRKKKIMMAENVELPQTNLETIICEVDDLKLRILPIIKVSPGLQKLKIYWKKKDISIMTHIFDCIMACENIRIIEFAFEDVFLSENTLPFRDNFNFSYKFQHYEIIICKKSGKITCKKM